MPTTIELNVRIVLDDEGQVSDVYLRPDSALTPSPIDVPDMLVRSAADILLTAATREPEAQDQAVRRAPLRLISTV